MASHEDIDKQSGNSQNYANAQNNKNELLLEETSKTEIAYQKFRKQLMDHAQAGFLWQRRASSVLLILVVIVVTAGVIFSAAQLWRTLHMGQPLQNTDLEISASKIRITSSVVGVVVLALSLVFLYLFIEQVYRIELVNVTPIQRSAE